MIFAKKRMLSLVTGALFLFVSCQSGSETNDTKAHTSDSSLNDTLPMQANAGLLGTDSGIVVKEMHRNATQLLGFWQQIPLKDIKQAIQINAPLIVNRIVKDKYKMEGGLTVLYKEFPDLGSVDVFIGIPVKPMSNEKMPTLTDGFVLENLPSASFFKATVNAEPGKTLNSWRKFRAWMQKNGFSQPSDNAKDNFPYFEYFQDSRNAEMTTTVSPGLR
ncbi:MAG: hypothetical protein ACKOI1_03540 [Bacteroidota bacterium]